MRTIIKLISTAGTGHFYTTTKNAKLSSQKLELKKYDPVIRKHAVHLSILGKKVIVLDRAAPWESRESDPSVALSPFTCERLATNPVELVRDARVSRVARQNGHYEVTAVSGQSWITPYRPFLATGFRGGLCQIKELFAWRKDGTVILNKSDESTRTPGLFVVGPQIRHQKLIFCFIYKFRQRSLLFAGRSPSDFLYLLI